jgi:bifunctional non-homologous end joining protein LigD
VPKNKLTARFIEPMLLLRTNKLPEGPGWLRELKFDGYRALAIKAGGRLQLRSRNDNDFGARYPAILKALAPMPDETVIDGEVAPQGAPRPLEPRRTSGGNELSWSSKREKLVHQRPAS